MGEKSFPPSQESSFWEGGRAVEKRMKGGGQWGRVVYESQKHLHPNSRRGYATPWGPALG